MPHHQYSGCSQRELSLRKTGWASQKAGFSTLLECEAFLKLEGGPKRKRRKRPISLAPVSVRRPEHG